MSNPWVFGIQPIPSPAKTCTWGFLQWVRWVSYRYVSLRIYSTCGTFNGVTPRWLSRPWNTDSPPEHLAGVQPSSTHSCWAQIFIGCYSGHLSWHWWLYDIRQQTPTCHMSNSSVSWRSLASIDQADPIVQGSPSTPGLKVSRNENLEGDATKLCSSGACSHCRCKSMN